jgi:signal transduction histidine kinase
MPRLGFGATRAARRAGTGRTRLRALALAHEITTAEERERERVAFGLHDDTGELLALARLKLLEMRGAALGAAVDRLDELATLLGQATASARAATFDLCNPVLKLGLQPALTSLADRLARECTLDVVLDGDPTSLTLPETEQAALFRVVRELCLNACKHAHGATTLRITCAARAGELRIEVRDDGAGFLPVPSAQGGAGYGLASAHAQMRALGGQLLIDSAPGRGTRACALLPLAA